MENSQEQYEKQIDRGQKYDWLKGYQFVKGQSGNPGGRPKGSKSLKTFAREYLEALPEDEKIEFMKTLPSDLIWKMAEGNPETKSDVTSGGEKIMFLPAELINKNNISNDSNTSTIENS